MVKGERRRRGLHGPCPSPGRMRAIRSRLRPSPHIYHPPLHLTTFVCATSHPSFSRVQISFVHLLALHSRLSCSNLLIIGQIRCFRTGLYKESLPYVALPVQMRFVHNHRPGLTFRPFPTVHSCEHIALLLFATGDLRSRRGRISSPFRLRRGTPVPRR